jgi:YidC/Oxa1 family membrane protein insertase
MVINQRVLFRLPMLSQRRQLHQIGDLTNAGLASWKSPTGIVQGCMEHLHVSAGLPWWACVAGIALCTRFAIFPLAVKSQHLAFAMSKIHPQARSLNERLQAATALNNVPQAQALTEQLQMLYRENGANPVGQILFSLAPAPLFFVNFVALRNLASANIPSITESGGMLWFANLSAPDPFYILPVLSSLTILGSFELTRKFAGSSLPPQTKMQTSLIRGMCFVGLPFVMGMPSMLTLYFVVTNLLTAVQAVALSRPWVKRLLKLPVQPNSPVNPNNLHLSKESALKEVYESQVKYKSVA